MADQESVSSTAKDVTLVNKYSGGFKHLLMEYLYTILKNDDLSFVTSAVLTSIEYC